LKEEVKVDLMELKVIHSINEAKLFEKTLMMKAKTYLASFKEKKPLQNNFSIFKLCMILLAKEILTTFI
jgi:hypothetical protein